MPLQSQQIVSMALQIAKCPGFTQQGGQFLNSLLQDLCENYDLDLALGTFIFNFNSATGQGAGPYNLPTDYLRTQVKDGKDEFFYTIQGVPYPLIQITKAEYDWLVQTPGFQSFPYNYATDLSQSPAQLFVWPPANGAYPCVLRYYRLMPDIVTPETSATVPWFNNTQVLIRGTAGLLMQLTGDDRTAEFLGDDEERYPLGVGTILKKYLRNVEDREGAVHTVGKDRRRWGRPFDQLKNTKNIGWALAAMFLGAWLYFGAATPTYANCTAPCTKAQVNTDITTNWPDNTAGLITPALLRSTVLDLVNSYLDTNGAASFTCSAGTPWVTAIATLSTYTCSGFPQTMPISAAPGTPASGNETIWFDSTDLRLHDKNASATIGTTAVANAGSANNFFTAMSSAGVFSTAQPAFSNISGQTTLTQLPSIANNTFLGNVSGSTATPSALTPGQVGGALCVPNRQIFTSGTAQTYTTPTCNSVTATWLEVDVQGGGAGGSGSSTSAVNAGTAGNASSFGALTANGGSAAAANSDIGGAGGTCSGSLGTQQNFIGSAGISVLNTSANSAAGGPGGVSYYGGQGAPSTTTNAGGAAPANSGGGGAGGSGSSTANVLTAPGGGAGCHIKTIINSAIAATYTYTVGASAAGGAAGTSGFAGGAGAAGLIDVVAHWQ